MKALTCTHDGVTVILKGDDSRIDSRIVARLLGIQHASFIRTLEQHQGELAECGIFRFQIGKISGRGRPEKYALHTAAQQLQAAAQARGSSAPAHAPHINLERLNNKLLGRKAGERADYTPAEKAVLATLCQLEQRAIERTINDGGDDRQAFQAAKSAAGAYMRQFGQDLMEAA